MKFRKKPVVIEAIKFNYTETGITELYNFIGDALGAYGHDMHPPSIPYAEIRTLEDGEGQRVKHIASDGDWIIKGVAGEFYPCKPHIFEQTYERVEE